MFTIKEIIRLLTRIFVKQNKKFPKGLEGVDIRIKAKEIFDVGKKEGYTGRISENQLKQFLAFEKQAKPTETIVKEGKVIPFKYKKSFKQEIDEMTIGDVIPKESPLTRDSSLRIKQGLSTKMKLNSLRENEQFAKDLIHRKNTEFNSLDRAAQKEVLERLDINIKNSINR